MAEMTIEITLEERSTVLLVASGSGDFGLETYFIVNSTEYETAPSIFVTADSLGGGGAMFGVTTLDAGNHEVGIFYDDSSDTIISLQAVVGENTEGDNLIA